MAVDHLRVADQNRDLALALLHPSFAGVRPRRWEWVGVVAFYAAVHYVNAHLWETVRFAPANHAERTHALFADPRLRPAREGYQLLRRYAFEARYDPIFEATEADARELIDNDLRSVEVAVSQVLGLSVPIWRLPRES